MILESCQLLSTTVRGISSGEYNDKVYRVSHLNHPCAKWVRASSKNFLWLFHHVQHMHQQRGRPHKSALLFPVFLDFWEKYKHSFPEFEATPFANCARNKDLGLDFTCVPDTHLAYRLYTSERWRRDTISLSWADGKKPEWYKE